jgi:hypothetical protein
MCEIVAVATASAIAEKKALLSPSCSIFEQEEPLTKTQLNPQPMLSFININCVKRQLSGHWGQLYESTHNKIFIALKF